MANTAVSLLAQGPYLCCPPSQCSGTEITLQVSRRVQIFLVSGFTTPHCLLRSHSFPVGKTVPVNPKAISRRPKGRPGKSWAYGSSTSGLRVRGCSLPEKLLWASEGNSLLGTRTILTPQLPAQALILVTPSPKQGNRDQGGHRHVGCQGSQLWEGSGTLDLGERREKHQEPRVRNNAFTCLGISSLSLDQETRAEAKLPRKQGVQVHVHVKW